MTKLLEVYILAEDKQESLSRLLPGTDEHTYITIVHKLISENQPISKNEKKMIDRLVPQSPQDIGMKEIRLRVLLKELFEEKDDAQRKKISKKINDVIFNYQFSYKRPSGDVGGTEPIDGDKALSSKLEVDLIEDAKNIVKSVQKISQLKALYIPELAKYLLEMKDKFEQFIKKEPESFIWAVKTVPSLIDNPKAIDGVITCLKQRISDVEDVWSLMTLQNLRKVAKKIKDDEFFTVPFVEAFYFKSFGKPLDLITDVSEVKMIYLWANSNEFIKKNFPKAKREINLRILYLLGKEKKTEMEFFEDYIKDPVEKTHQLFSKSFLKKRRKEDYNEYSFLNYAELNQSEIILRHLELLHKEGNDIMKYSGFLKIKYLAKLIASWKLKAGSKDPKLTALFKKSELEALNKNKYINFETKKLPPYSPGEKEIEIVLNVKNINTIYVQVFEIDTKSYLIENRVPIPENIPLDGLISVDEQKLTYTNYPAEEHTETIKLTKITGFKRGVYVVNIIGDGVYSRAVLRRGQLNLFKEQTIDGYKCFILDENSNKCKGEGTGLYYLGKFYPTSIDGIIDVGFKIPSGDQTLILVHEGFGFISRQKFNSDNYDLKANWIFNEETFFAGNKCQLLLNTQMYLNGIYYPRSNIRSCEVEIIFINDNDDKSIESIKDIALEESSDQVITFMMPNLISRIILKTKLEFIRASTGKPEKVIKERTISFTTRKNTNRKLHFFLQQREMGYFLLLKGKNGEKIPNAKTSIRFKRFFSAISYDASYITDSNGEIALGDISKQVYHMYVSSQVQSESVNAQFFIQERNSKTNGFERCFLLYNGDNLSLPAITPKPYDFPQYTLKRIIRNPYNIIEDLSKQHLRLSLDEVVVHDLIREGDYQLSNHLTGYRYLLKVVDGKEINDTLIKCDSCYYYRSLPHISPPSLTASLITPTSLTLRSALRPSLPFSVHIFSSSHNSRGVIVEQSDECVGRCSYEPVSSLECSSSFISSSVLPSEKLYALRRKQQGTPIGMSSLRPRVVVRAKDLGETTLQSEHSTLHSSLQKDPGEWWESQERREKGSQQPEPGVWQVNESAQQAPKKKRGPRKQMKQREKEALYGPGEEDEDEQEGEFVVERMMEYLKHSGNQILNIKPDSNGVVNVDVTSLKGSHLTIYCVNQNGWTVQNLYLPGRDKIEQKDLRLQNSRDASKTFAYSREIKTVIEDEQIELPITPGTELEVIDSISKVIKIISQFSKDTTNCDDNWEKLRNWGELEFSEMMKYIDENFSYELIFFIYKSDKDLFDSIILPFIKCKVEKNFLDYYLMEEHEMMQQYLIPTKLSTLTCFEKICLIDSLPSSFQTHKKNILNIIEGEDVLNDYSGSLSAEKIFDRLLHNKLSGGDKVSLNQAKFKYVEANIDYDCHSIASSPRSLYSGDEMSSHPQIQSNQNNIMRPTGLLRNGLEDDASSNSRELDYEQNMIMIPQQLSNYLEEEENEIPVFEQRLIRANTFDEEDEQKCSSRNSNTCTPPLILIGPQETKVQIRDRRRLSGLSNSEDEERLTDSEGEEEGEDDSQEENPTIIRYINREVNLRHGNSANMKKTRMYVERGYLMNRDVKVNKFWVDLARHLVNGDDKPFISENFIFCSKEEIPLVVAFLGLEFTSESYEIFEKESKKYLKVKNNSLVLIKHLKEQEGDEDNSQTLLVAQKIFDESERTVYDEKRNSNVEKIVNFFIKGKIYGSQLVLSNVSSIQQSIQIITEIPQGSLPIRTSEYHQSFDLTIDEFSTKKVEIFFYFPEEGQYTFCPACVTNQGMRVPVQASNLKINVLATKPSEISIENASGILQSGDKELVLNFLETQNIFNKKLFNISMIYWLLKDKEFFLKTIEILRNRLYYDDRLWSFGLYHGEIDVIKELLSKNQKLLSENCSLLYLNLSGEEIVNTFSLVEFNPIMNSRFHQLSDTSTSILNTDFFNKYSEFLTYLFQKSGKIEPKDWMIFCYYLILQDRIEEAIEISKRIEPTQVNFKVQYDYMLAFFDMYVGMPDFKVAREICERNIAYPIEEWRELFMDIVNQLAEYDGEAAGVILQNKKESSADSKPLITPEIKGEVVKVLYKKVEELRFDFFEIDLEILFSVCPFLGEEFNKLVYVKPHHTEAKKVDQREEMEVMELAIPEFLRNKNFIVKVSCGDVKNMVVHSNSKMIISIDKEEGTIKALTPDMKPLSKVYVKCFSRGAGRGSTEEFFKDGYTDIRGSFTYFDRKTSNISDTERFSILVSHSSFGNT